jgi:hypothetical protein
MVFGASFAWDSHNAFWKERLITQEDYLLICNDKFILIIMAAHTWDPDHKHIFIILEEINEW